MLRRNRLRDHALSGGPFAADSQSGNRSPGHQRAQRMRAGAHQRARSVNQRGGYNHRLAADAIAEQTKRDAAQRGHQKGEAQHQGGIGGTQMQFTADSYQQEGVEDQIEEIEDPGEKAQDYDAVMLRRQSRALIE